jgi:hypothetical protein
MKGRFMPAVRTPTFSHYQSLRRSNPDLFYQLSTQRQMRDSYVVLGAAFFDAFTQSKVRP